MFNPCGWENVLDRVCVRGYLLEGVLVGYVRGCARVCILGWKRGGNTSSHRGGMPLRPCTAPNNIPGWHRGGGGEGEWVTGCMCLRGVCSRVCVTGYMCVTGDMLQGMCYRVCVLVVCVGEVWVTACEPSLTTYQLQVPSRHYPPRCLH